MATKQAKRPKNRRTPRRFRPSWGWYVAAASVALVVAMVFLGDRSPRGAAVAAGGKAPPFTLASTDGSSVSLSDFRGKSVLLYFNEGVGCDACFYQTVALEKATELRAAGVTLLPIVMNPADQVEPYLQQLGISTPYLIDANGSISSEYGMLGHGMHANLPGHGFVFIDGSGRIRWQQEYPSMYASSSEIMSRIQPYLG